MLDRGIYPLMVCAYYPSRMHRIADPDTHVEGFMHAYTHVVSLNVPRLCGGNTEHTLSDGRFPNAIRSAEIPLVSDLSDPMDIGISGSGAFPLFFLSRTQGQTFVYIKGLSPPVFSRINQAVTDRSYQTRLACDKESPRRFFGFFTWKRNITFSRLLVLYSVLSRVTLTGICRLRPPTLTSALNLLA